MATVNVTDASFAADVLGFVTAQKRIGATDVE
jgi:hypothetical protein